MSLSRLRCLTSGDGSLREECCCLRRSVDDVRGDGCRSFGVCFCLESSLNQSVIIVSNSRCGDVGLGSLNRFCFSIVSNSFRGDRYCDRRDLLCSFSLGTRGGDNDLLLCK